MKTLSLTLAALILFSCKKKETAPTTTTQPTNTTVYCFMQTNFGSKVFLYCAKSEAEKQQKIQQYQGTSIQFVIETKSNCSECK